MFISLLQRLFVVAYKIVYLKGTAFERDGGVKKYKKFDHLDKEFMACHW